jgi:hypothetical protein
MATLKDRHKCCVCGNLAINALEFKDKNGICQSVIWFCDKEYSRKAITMKSIFSLETTKGIVLNQ